MGINDKLIDNLIYDSIRWEYGLDESLLREFSSACSECHAKKAHAAMDNIIKQHQKEPLLDFIVRLAEVETGIRELEPSHRDHVVHALQSYLLGAYLNEYYLIHYVKVNPFQWKIAGLFHDIAYPLQLAYEISCSFADRINSISEEINSECQEVSLSFALNSIEKLTTGQNSLDLLHSCINNKWSLDVDVKTAYRESMSEKPCHGIISAISLMYVIDLMYKKNNPVHAKVKQDDYGCEWGRTAFENDIVSACAAIFLHNLDRKYLKGKVNKGNAPLAFLLILVDSLQEWERPSGKNPRGYSQMDFNVDIVDRKIEFTVPNETLKEKILEELYEKIIGKDADDIMLKLMHII